MTREERTRTVSTLATRLRTMRDRVASDRDQRVNEVEGLASKHDLLVKTGKIFQLLMDRLVDSQVKVVEEVVTAGLKSIFCDQHLTFEAEVSQKRNRVSVDFFFRQGELDRGGCRGSPLESFGGGPTSFAGLAIRIMTLLRLKRRPLLLLDETLAAVSDTYIEATGQFLQRLAETSSIDLLLVTHKAGFLEQARVGYHASEECRADGTRCLTVKATRAP